MAENMTPQSVFQFHIRTAGSAAAAACNDDAYGANDQYLWIVDGATDVGTLRCTRWPSDAAWLADAINRWLHAATSRLPAESVQALLQQLQTHLKFAFAEETHAAGVPQVDSQNGPTACLGLLRLSGDALEVACVGDVSIAILPPDGTVQLLTDKGIEACAARTLVALREAHQAGLSGAALLQRIRPVLHANRAFANRPNGYRIVHPQQTWTEGLSVQRLSVAEHTRVLLSTDGLWRMVDTFGRCDAPELAEQLERVGFEGVVEQLRDLELSDPQGLAYIRVKCSDDATAILATVQRQTMVSVRGLP